MRLNLLYDSADAVKLNKEYSRFKEMQLSSTVLLQLYVLQQASGCHS
jgi:hypothetical protein